jgi:hypothetical protein
MSLPLFLKKNHNTIFVILLSTSFFACEQSKNIGFDLVKKENVRVIESDTFTVKVSTVQGATTLTKNAGVLLCGKYQDPDFGLVEASLFTQFLPTFDQISTVSVGDKPLNFDSVTVNFGYYSKYGVTNKKQKFHLHRLITQDLSDGTDYTINSTSPYDPSPLATIELMGDTIAKRGVLTYNLVTSANKPEQTLFAGGQLLGNELMNFARNNSFKSAITGNFRGFTLIPDNADDAGVMGFYGDFNSKLIIHYSQKEARTGKPDTTIKRVVEFYPTNAKFNRIQKNRQNTQIQDLITEQQSKDISLTNGIAYLQAGLGIQIKVEFPTLKNIKRLGNVGVNRAELIIRPKVTSLDIYKAPEFLTLYETNASNNIQTRTDNNGVTSNITIIPDRTNSPLVPFDTFEELYRISMPNQIQRILSDITQNPALLITPSNNIGSVQRLIFDQKNVDYRIKLRVIYTVFE